MKVSQQQDRAVRVNKAVAKGLLPAVLSVLMSVLSLPVFAVTLGDEEVLSWLGDPVEVEIDVLQWQDTDLDQVSISVASRSEYEAFNLTWLPVLEQLSFNLIGPNGRGDVRVLVSTRNPVSEPYIDLLLVMRWPGGSLLREIVLLFDLPPTTKSRMAEPQIIIVPDSSDESLVITEENSEPLDVLVIESETVASSEEGTGAEPVELEEQLGEQLNEQLSEQLSDETAVIVTESVEQENIGVTPPADLPDFRTDEQTAIVIEQEPVQELADNTKQIETNEQVDTNEQTGAVQQVETQVEESMVMAEAVITEPVVEDAVDVAEPVAQTEPSMLVVNETNEEPGVVVTKEEAQDGNADTQRQVAAEAPELTSTESELSVIEEALAEPAEPTVDVRTQQAITVDLVSDNPQLQGTNSRRVYQVRQGDILWNIAQQFLPAGGGENLYQMLLGLHELNRSAFINGNISLLKADAMMQIPSLADIDNVPAESAQRVFEQLWAEGTQRMQLAKSGDEQPEFTELNSGEAPQDDTDSSIEPAADTSTTDERNDTLESVANNVEESISENNSLLAPTESMVVLPATTEVPQIAVAIPTEDLDTTVESKDAQTTENSNIETEVATDELTGSAETALSSSVQVAQTDTTDQHDDDLTLDASQPALNESSETIQDSSDTVPAVVLSDRQQPADTDNPYLNRINDSARELETLLSARAMQIARLEEQLVDMRIRMREAEQMASELGDSLQSLLEQRRNRDSNYQRNTSVLAGFSALLLLTVVMGTMLIMRLLVLLRTQRRQLALALQDQDAYLSEDDEFEDMPVEAKSPQADEAKEGFEHVDYGDGAGMEVIELDDVAEDDAKRNTHENLKENETPESLNKVD